MATLSHCAFCFETLYASLEKRRLPDLANIEQLWEQYSRQETLDDADEVDASNDLVSRDGSSLQDFASMENRSPLASNITNIEPSAGSASRQGHQLATNNPSSLRSTTSLASNASSKPSNDTTLSVSSSRTSLSSVMHTPEASPMFITWNTLTRSGSKRLRGCIGTFEAQEIGPGLTTYTLTSAFQDTRFAPIDTREFASLECGVTLLTDFEPAPSPLSWEIGKHGLRISFSHHGRRYGATYLPDVAQEQDWTKTETLISLMRKAGWKGRDEDWHKIELTVTRYQGHKVSMPYRDWREFHDWCKARVEDV